MRGEKQEKTYRIVEYLQVTCIFWYVFALLHVTVEHIIVHFSLSLSLSHTTRLEFQQRRIVKCRDINYVRRNFSKGGRHCRIVNGWR
jgi:hypothetical protein